MKGETFMTHCRWCGTNVRNYTDKSARRFTFTLLLRLNYTTKKKPKKIGRCGNLSQGKLFYFVPHVPHQQQQHQPRIKARALTDDTWSPIMEMGLTPCGSPSLCLPPPGAHQFFSPFFFLVFCHSRLPPQPEQYHIL